MPVYASICAYRTFSQNMHDPGIRTLNLMHTSRLSRLLDHECSWSQIVLLGVSILFWIPASTSPASADIGRPALAPSRPPPPAMTPPARASNLISRMPMFASWHGFVAAMWRRTLARLRNLQRWESSPYDVQCGPPRAPRQPYVRWLTFTVSCQCATLVSELQCKCIMMGIIHLHAWTRTHAP